MRGILAFGAVAALAINGMSLSAAELKSGLAVGAPVGPFQVIKHGGIDDGVKVGEKLCYR